MVYSVPYVLKLRDKIVSSLYVYPGTTPSGDSFNSLIDDILSVLPSEIDRKIIISSVQDIAGKTLTESLIKSTAWRLAANFNTLKEGKAVRLWTQQKISEWVPMQIIRSQSVTYKHQPAFAFSICILAGTAASLIISKVWSSKLCFIMSNEFGFTKPWGNYPFSNGLEFVSMRFLGQLEPALSTDKPYFDKVKCSSATKKWNRGLMMLRQREGFSCPENYKIPCHLCWRGYRSCPAACRPTDLTNKYCNTCKQDSWFDEEIEENVCLQCLCITL